MKSVHDLKPGDTVKALTLWEPWATFAASGLKTFETRGWDTNHRGPLLICAAKRFHRGELEEALGDPGFRAAFAAQYGPPYSTTSGYRASDLADLAAQDRADGARWSGDWWKGVSPSDMHGLWYGCAVALVDLAYTTPTTEARGGPALRELALGNYEDGRYAFKFLERRRLVPWPVTGKQGFFYVRLPEGLREWPS